MSTALPLEETSAHSDIESSRAYCKQIVRKRALNFYYGMRLVPEPQRSANYALYAWMRQADDITDDAGSVLEKTLRLNDFWADTQRAADSTESLPNGPLWASFRDLIGTYQLPLGEFRSMIDGQLLDLEKTRYATFDELYSYCYNVASVVGLLSIRIWGFDSAQAPKLAEYRGIAFQLINIVRDVHEDAQRDRVYLPVEFLGGPLEPAEILAGESPALMAAIHKTIGLAREYLARSQPLDELINPSCRGCLWAMTEIYRQLLDRIERDPASVLKLQPVRLSTPRKFWILLQAVGR